MAHNGVYWIKLRTNLFDDESMLLLESLPDGDSLIVIYIKLQVLAGRCNESGFLVMRNGKPYTDESLAVVVRRPIMTVRLALSALQEIGLIEFVENKYLIAAWDADQNIDGLNKIREQGRKRAAAFRERKKSNVTHNVTKTLSNATEKEVEKNKEIEALTDKIWDSLLPDIRQYYLDIVRKKITKIGPLPEEGILATARKMAVDDYKNKSEPITNAN